MKRFKNIYAIAFAMFALCSCEQSNVLENEDNEILIPEQGYIFFDAGLDSRGTLVHGDSFDKDFSLLGYKYINTDTWASTNVFANLQDNSSYIVFKDKPLAVNYNNGHSYDDNGNGLVAWEDKRYSFFAYYPVITDENKNYLSWSKTKRDEEGNIVLGTDNNPILIEGINQIGTPYITYKLDRTNPANHLDVMTACKVNHKVGKNNAAVQLEFEHRLSALEITARSSVDAAALELENAADRTAKVLITGLKIQLDNIEYDTAEIPLNTQADDNNGNILPIIGYNSETSGSKTVTYGNLLDRNVTLQKYTSNEHIAQLTSDDKKTMVLIPQTNAVKCTLTINYDFVNENGESLWNELYPIESERPEKKHVEENVSINKLLAGTYYEIHLNFTKSGINIQVKEPEEWANVDVNHEFE